VSAKWNEFLGLAGVASHEPAAARRWHQRFEWFLVPLALWLPLQWYLEPRGELGREHIQILDWFVWGAFALETGVLTILVRDRWRYLLGNWLNLAIIVLAFPLYWHTGPWLAIARGLRLFVLFSVLIRISRFLRAMLVRNQLGPILLALIVVTLLAGVFVAAVDPAFKTPYDGIWWAWETLATVGYGDFVPTTLAARLIAIVLMLSGVGLIGVFAATLSELFIEDEERRSRKQRNQILDQLVQHGQDFDRAAIERAEMLRLLNELLRRVDAMERSRRH
jgi:voltage-gated potassium channel